ncbi:hypothetical protein ABBQ38_014489 [Trebouxia sp. C0009 RCD-2024]
MVLPECTLSRHLDPFQQELDSRPSNSAADLKSILGIHLDILLHCAGLSEHEPSTLWKECWLAGLQVLSLMVTQVCRYHGSALVCSYSTAALVCKPSAGMTVEACPKPNCVFKTSCEQQRLRLRL